MSKNSKFQITNDDLKCLNFLWKWKLSTTSIIYQAIYSNRSIEKCYRRLIKLEDQKYIESFSSLDRSVSVWQLTDRGYQLLNFDGIEFSQNGFRSENPEHDYWVSVVHQGLWIGGMPRNTDLFTEQELRRIDIGSYPSWVPHTKQHRPDGWWKTDLGKSNAESLIALEVEFSKKSPASYNEVSDFYSNVISVNQVIWVVKTKTDGNYILDHLRGGSSTEAKEHSFILLGQFIESQWQAEIIFGKDTGKRLAEILNSSNTDGRTAPPNHRLLDIRKYPVNPRTLRIANKADLGLRRHIKD